MTGLLQAPQTLLVATMEKLKNLIVTLNDVGMQVWAIIILVIGAVLVLAHQADHGSMVVGGGLTLLQHKQQDQK